jgi:hypothetical protein
MSVEVRAASKADFGALIQLNLVVQSLHAELYPGDFKREVDQSAVLTFFAARLADPKSVIAIAEADCVPAGYVWLEVQTRPETRLHLLDPASMCTTSRLRRKLDAVELPPL